MASKPGKITYGFLPEESAPGLSDEAERVLRDTMLDGRWRSATGYTSRKAAVRATQAMHDYVEKVDPDYLFSYRCDEMEGGVWMLKFRVTPR
jgi:hypothetical protein